MAVPAERCKIRLPPQAQKVLRILFRIYGSFPWTQIQKKCFVEDRCVNNGYTKTTTSTLILAQTCADCFESCITMYYLIPSARRKFDAESKVLQGFSSQRFHQNGHIYSYSGSNLRRALWIMYHHVIHDSKRSEQVWCKIQGFARVCVTMYL